MHFESENVNELQKFIKKIKKYFFAVSSLSWQNCQLSMSIRICQDNSRARRVSHLNAALHAGAYVRSSMCECFVPSERVCVRGSSILIKKL